MEISDIPKPDRLVDAEYVVLDVETSGKTPDSEVVEVAALRFRAGVVIEQLVTLVKPSRPVPTGAVSVHGLTTERLLREGLPRPAVAAWLQEFVTEKDVVVAHYADFDRGQVRVLNDRSWCCSFRLAKHLWENVPDGYGNVNLGSWLHLRELVPESTGVPHRAHFDAYLTGLVFRRALAAYQGLHPYATIQEVVEFAKRPLDITRYHVGGKHYGTPIIELPDWVLRTALEQADLPRNQRAKWAQGLDNDTVFALRLEHARRASIQQVA